MNATYTTGEMPRKIQATDFRSILFTIPANFNVMMKQGLKLLAISAAIISIKSVVQTIITDLST